MIKEYIDAALKHAQYEIIQDEEPFYAEVPALQDVWATGGTLEACRETLASTVEGWVLLCLSRGLQIPVLDGVEVKTPHVMDLA